MLIDNLVRVTDRYIDRDAIQVAYDIGTRDMMQAIEICETYPQAHVHAFECNPQFLPECRTRESSRITLHEVCAHNFTGETTFHRITVDNPGASSIFFPEHTILGRDHKHQVAPVTVPCVRIDSMQLPQPDVLWMDVQGAELVVLEGMGEMLDKVKVIATEVETAPVYAPTEFEEPTNLTNLSAFLFDRGFVLVDFVQDWEKEANVVYVKRSLIC